MEGGAKFLGHQIHPMVIVFPLGLLSTAGIFDIVYYATATAAFTTVSYYLLLAGLMGGVLAAIFGAIDWFAIPSGTRAKTIGAIHGMVNAVALVLFLGSWYMRPSSLAEPGAVAMILAIAGLVVALVGGWLGGELVERLGIGVHTGAHPDAPSSLETENATGQKPGPGGFGAQPIK